jgi:hypothetical protein
MNCILEKWITWFLKYDQDHDYESL